MDVVIDFDGEVPDGDRPLGIDVATREFLRAYFRFADQSRFRALVPDSAAFAAFRELAETENIAPERCTTVAGIDDPALGQAGTLMRYDPALGIRAWRRRRHGQRRFSLVGIAHATASLAVRDSIGTLAAAPLQEWDALICPSQAIKLAIRAVLDGWNEYLAERVGAERALPMPLQLPVIPLGVDTVRFDKIAGSDKRAAQRTRLGLGAEEIAILYVGRLNYLAKANPLPLLLAAESAARRAGSPVHILFNGYFGIDDSEAAFTEAATAICKSAKVTIVRHGDPAYPDGVWAAADIFCSPVDNIQESFGLTPIEAMAAGLPAIVSDWDGYRDTVRDKVDGFLIPTLAPPPGAGAQMAYDYFAGRMTYGDFLGAAAQSSIVDTEALTRAIYTLITNAELRRDMGATAHRRAREVFEWSRIIRTYSNLWTELAETRLDGTERGAADGGRPFHPSHPDPFAMFEGFPSATIQAGGMIELTDLSWDDALLRIRLKIGLVYPQSLMPLEDLPLLIGQLEAGGPSGLAELAGTLKIEDDARFLRTVGWLVKLGICRYRAPE